MGNCVFKGFNSGEVVEQMIKVVTVTGGVMELYAPITAAHVTSEFPGHRLFRHRNPLFSDQVAVPHDESLRPGGLYYLLPLDATSIAAAADEGGDVSAMYRMSFDIQKTGKRGSDPDVVPRYNGSGVWKVRLVIDPEKLSEILSQEARTEELIESVRTVAKCGTGAAPPPSTVSPDQCSVASKAGHINSTI